MDQEKPANSRNGSNVASIVVFLLFLLWLPTYLIVVRPVLNQWLAKYFDWYPAILHLVPIIGLPVLVGLVLVQFFPPPKIENDNGATGSQDRS